tara:strand:- start:615 stop:749 length:135 start_codon:yes stop_codon:yes gene_type:complete
MSVRVENLTKMYDDQKAVDDLSFEVTEGRILGFWGQMVQGNLPL